VNHAKRSFFCTAKVGRLASEEVILELLKRKLVAYLFYYMDYRFVHWINGHCNLLTLHLIDFL